MLLIGFFVFHRTVFSLFFVMNLVLWSKGSSGAVPFSTLLALLALWFLVSVPLTFVGAYFGFRKRVSFHFYIDKDIYVLYITLGYSLIFDPIIFLHFFTGFGASGSNKSNSTPNTRSINLYTTNTRHYYGRCLTVRLHFHSTILYSKFNLVKSNVLHVRFLIPGFPYPGDNMLGNNRFTMLFPFVCRGLSLVVAIVPNIRLHGHLFIHLLLSLFCNKISH